MSEVIVIQDQIMQVIQKLSLNANRMNADIFIMGAGFHWKDKKLTSVPM